ncbi:DUF6940 family protein [Rhodohalobacter sp. 8-1]|uniref:DUF6940 family protein n=1 Tax=Rhodohalobacter sp. 8-1 TaxID=3131972 RepID=UPI0030EB8A09
MWNLNTLESSKNRFTFRLIENGESLSHRQFLTLLSENEEFIRWYNRLLADSEFDAFFWENKPVTEQNLDKDYECTLVESGLLSRVSPDTATFDSYFEDDSDVVQFPNLGDDAQLIVPCPITDDSVYTQIGNFVREAPDHQVQNLWKQVGKEMLNSVQKEPRWLSTSGLGVYWLHVRIDSVPKYYQTEEYKTV